MSGSVSVRDENLTGREEGIALPSVGRHHAICGGPEQNKKQKIYFLPVPA